MGCKGSKGTDAVKPLSQAELDAAEPERSPKAKSKSSERLPTPVDGTSSRESRGKVVDESSAGELISKIASRVHGIRVRAEKYRAEMQEDIVEIEREQPFLTEQINENGVVTDAYTPDKDSAANGALEADAGEKIEIIVKDAGGWAYCRKTGASKPGWLPSARVAELAVLIADHDASGLDGLLTGKKGDVMEVIGRHYSGWTFCREWAGPQIPGATSTRCEGWVTDCYLEDRRPEAMLATKWHRLVLQALDLVTSSAKELEGVLKGHGFSGESQDQWMGQCVEFVVWLGSELQRIRTAVAKHELAEAANGSFATVVWDVDSTGRNQLAARRGDRVQILDAVNADWAWCRKTAAENDIDDGPDGPQEGFIRRNVLMLCDKTGPALKRAVSPASPTKRRGSGESSSRPPGRGGRDNRRAATQARRYKLVELPPWVREGQACKWWSNSTSRFCEVEITSVSDDQQEVKIVFTMDRSSWKGIPFSHFAMPSSDWLLQPSDEAEQDMRNKMPEWVKKSGKAFWWSVSQRRCLPVTITEVNFRRSVINVVFDVDGSTRKHVSMYTLIEDPENCNLQADSTPPAHRIKKKSKIEDLGSPRSRKSGAGRSDSPKRKRAPESGSQDDAFMRTMTKNLGDMFSTMQRDLSNMLGEEQESQLDEKPEESPRSRPESPGSRPHTSPVCKELASSSRSRSPVPSSSVEDGSPKMRGSPSVNFLTMVSSHSFPKGSLGQQTEESELGDLTALEGQQGKDSPDESGILAEALLLQGDGGLRAAADIGKDDKPHEALGKRDKELWLSDHSAVAPGLRYSVSEADLAACLEPSSKATTEDSSLGARDLNLTNSELDLLNGIDSSQPALVPYSKSEVDLLDTLALGGQPSLRQLASAHSEEPDAEPEAAVGLAGRARPAALSDKACIQEDKTILQEMGDILTPNSSALLPGAPSIDHEANVKRVGKGISSVASDIAGAIAGAVEGAAKQTASKASRRGSAVTSAWGDDSSQDRRQQGDVLAGVGLLREALRVKSPDAWDSDGDEAPPEVERLSEAWPRVQEQYDAAWARRASQLREELDRDSDAAAVVIDARAAELRHRLEQRARAAEAKLDPGTAQRSRTMAWEVVNACEGVKDQRSRAKDAKLALRARGAQGLKESLRQAVQADAMAAAAATFLPDTESLRGLSLAGAVDAVSEAAGELFTAMQVVVVRPQVPRARRRPGLSEQARDAFQDHSETGGMDELTLEQTFQASLQVLGSCLESLGARLREERGKAPVLDPAVEVAAWGEDALTAQERRARAAEEARQEADWERELVQRVAKQAARWEAASKEALSRVSRVVQRRWRRRRDADRPQALKGLNALIEAIGAAEEDMTKSQRSFAETSEREAQEFRAARLEMHRQTRALSLAAQVISAEKSRMEQAATHEEKSQRKAMMLLSLRRVRRLNQDMRSLKVGGELKRNHSMLLHSLQLLEQRLAQECPDSRNDIEEGSLQTPEIQLKLEAADAAFQNQMDADLRALRERQSAQWQSFAAQEGVKLRNAIQAQHAGILPANRRTLDMLRRDFQIAGFSVLALGPLADAVASLGTEAFRGAEVEASAGKGAGGFGPPQSRVDAAIEVTLGMLSGLQAKLGQRLQPLGGGAKVVGVVDEEWEATLARAEARWQGFCDAHKESMPFSPTNGHGPRTPRGEESSDFEGARLRRNKSLHPSGLFLDVEAARPSNLPPRPATRPNSALVSPKSKGPWAGLQPPRDSAAKAPSHDKGAQLLAQLDDLSKAMDETMQKTNAMKTRHASNRPGSKATNVRPGWG